QARLELRLERVTPRAEESRRTSGMATIVGADPALGPLVGRLLYFSAEDDGGPPPMRSEVLAVRGTLSSVPHNSTPDSFNGYLDGMGVGLRMLRGRILGRV